MGGLYYLNVTLHILAAMLWLGGMFFLAVVGAPVLRRIESAPLRSELFRLLGARFRTIGWGAILVLLVTGIGNLAFRGVLSWNTLGAPAFWGTRFGAALAWKLGAVAFMLVASAIHDFVLGPAASKMDPRSTEAGRARLRAAWLARLNALAGLVAVLAAIRLARGG